MTPYLDPPSRSYLPRLFCFHHAGGGPSLFKHWYRTLSPHASVWPVLLPGRERRMREPRFTSLDALVADLDHHLGPYLTEPHVLFGHSMGALIAYRLACHRRAKGETAPRSLVLSAYAAPHLPQPFPSVDGLDDTRVAQLIEGVGGVMRDLPEQWRNQLVAEFRDDMRLCASHTDAGEAPLALPIHVYGGDADPLVDSDELRAWERHTTEPVNLRIFHGGHFYLRDTPEPFLHDLRSLLQHDAAPGDMRASFPRR